MCWVRIRGNVVKMRGDMGGEMGWNKGLVDLGYDIIGERIR